MPPVVLIIDDKTVSKYDDRGKGNREAALIATLTKFADVDPGDGVVVLHGDDLRKVRDKVGNFASGKELAIIVERGGTISLKGAASGVYIPLTTIQKKRIKEEADRLGLTEIQALQGALKEAVAVRYGPF